MTPSPDREDAAEEGRQFGVNVIDAELTLPPEWRRVGVVDDFGAGFLHGSAASSEAEAERAASPEAAAGGEPKAERISIGHCGQEACS